MQQPGSLASEERTNSVSMPIVTLPQIPLPMDLGMQHQPQPSDHLLTSPVSSEAPTSLVLNANLPSMGASNFPTQPSHLPTMTTTASQTPQPDSATVAMAAAAAMGKLLQQDHTGGQHHLGNSGGM